jgi:hypothetical protein
MSKILIRTLKQGREELAKRGIDAKAMSIRDMQAAINQADKAPKLAVKLPAIATPAVDALESLKAAAKAERNPTAKANLLQDLSDKLLTKLNSENDAVKATDLRRELQAAQKAQAYALLAERSVDPKAARARRLIDLAS